MEISRELYPVLEGNLFKGKTLLVFGARRVGKTHLVKQLLRAHEGYYYNCESLDIKELLSATDSAALEQLVGHANLIVFDEAQVIPEIGMKLKLLHDSFPEKQFIATGSSAYELINEISEPLTGRSRMFRLYPYSYREISNTLNPVEAYANIESILRFGMYPDVFQKSYDERREELMNIVSGYLYKDMLVLANLRRPDLILDILKLLAFQIGKEVSLNEISNKVNTSVHTVRRYLDLLERTFVITSLTGFSRNLRNEIGKSRKYYFIDCGIRNALINNFNTLSQRNDTGQLWENFCVLERMKKNEYARRFVNTYFWRTYDQKEIDYVEEIDGELYAFEFKWHEVKGKRPTRFLETYPGSGYKVISKNNLPEFV